MVNRLTCDQEDELTHRLLGTCESVEWALARMGAEHIAGDMALDQVAGDVERCRGCGWWMEPCMLDSEEDIGEAGYCDQCRKEWARD